MRNVFDRIASQDHGDPEPTTSASEPPELPESPELSELSNPESSQETSFTPSEVKETTQELLRYGYIDEERKPALYRKTVIREQGIGKALEPLDLALRLDTYRGVAFLVVAGAAYESSGDGEEWAHPLVRRQRLTLEQSLLVAILRQAFVMHEQEAGIGQSAAKLAVEDLLPQFLTYFEDSGSDAKNESRLSNLLDQLKTYGVVSEVDKNQEVTIRPMIAHLANPESLTGLLRVFQDNARDTDPAAEES